MCVCVCVCRLYACMRVEDTQYLAADFSVQCYTSKWNSYAYVDAAAECCSLCS